MGVTSNTLIIVICRSKRKNREMPFTENIYSCVFASRLPISQTFVGAQGDPDVLCILS
jgi:hypothetical protein